MLFDDTEENLGLREKPLRKGHMVGAFLLMACVIGLVIGLAGGHIRSQTPTMVEHSSGTQN